MTQEVSVYSPLLEILVVAQRRLTVLSSGFNALYFLSYRALTPRRRVGARVLALANLALVEDLRLSLLLGLLPLLASLAMSALILRQLWHRRRH